MYVPVCVSMYIRMHISIYAYMLMHVCLYVCVYTYTHMHILMPVDMKIHGYILEMLCSYAHATHVDVHCLPTTLSIL